MNKLIKPGKLRKNFKRKVFFSNELKKALFKSFIEAKNNKTYITPELLLYGLLSQPNSIGAKIILTTLVEFRNNKSLTSNLLAERIRQLNQQNLETNSLVKNSEFSTKLWSENEVTPWFTPQIKTLIKKAISSSLDNQNTIVILTTKHLVFELLSQESIRDSLRQLVN